MSKFGDLIGGKKSAPAAPAAPAPVAVPTPPAEAIEPDLGEDTIKYESDVSFKDMSKKELEDYGRTVGIELDRRHSRKKLMRELEDYLGVSDS